MTDAMSEWNDAQQCLKFFGDCVDGYYAAFVQGTEKGGHEECRRCVSFVHRSLR